MRGATKLAARGLSAKTIFQSTLPMRGATHTAYKAVQPLGFQSTLPMRGATSLTGQPAGHRNISIHAPHAGSDHRRVEQHTGEDYFNPRSPCGERRHTRATVLASALFQSTLPMRGATICREKIRRALLYFNPRSPCGERRFHGKVCAGLGQFQSTLPMRGATGGAGGLVNLHTISIHAPHAGSDHRRVEQHTGEDYFNPRSPCGERPLHGSVAWCENNFNPRSPCGERHHHNGDHYHDNQFQSTLPMRGATSPWCRR